MPAPLEYAVNLVRLKLKAELFLVHRQVVADRCIFIRTPLTEAVQGHVGEVGILLQGFGIGEHPSVALASPATVNVSSLVLE